MHCSLFGISINHLFVAYIKMAKFTPIFCYTILLTCFYRYITSKDNSFYNSNIHWRPQVALCNPCAVNYDFVIDFENLAQDSNHLLKYIQRNDPEFKKVFFDESTKNVINENDTLLEFSKLDKEVVRKLMEMCNENFKIFNYKTL